MSRGDIKKEEGKRGRGEEGKVERAHGSMGAWVQGGKCSIQYPVARRKGSEAKKNRLTR
jgi:hypothetical protein